MSPVDSSALKQGHFRNSKFKLHESKDLISMRHHLHPGFHTTVGGWGGFTPARHEFDMGDIPPSTFGNFFLLVLKI
jgi:hypothetical protein